MIGREEWTTDENVSKQDIIYKNVHVMLITRAGTATTLVLSSLTLRNRPTLDNLRQALKQTPLSTEQYDVFLEKWAKLAYVSKRDIYGRIRKLQDSTTLHKLLRDELRMPGTVTFCVEQCRNPRYSCNESYQLALNWIPNRHSQHFERAGKQLDSAVSDCTSTSSTKQVESQPAQSASKSNSGASTVHVLSPPACDARSIATNTAPGNSTDMSMYAPVDVSYSSVAAGQEAYSQSFTPGVPMTVMNQVWPPMGMFQAYGAPMQPAPPCPMIYMPPFGHATMHMP